MPWMIVKQPNGLYARFSTVVEAFTHLNLFRAEAVAVCRGEYRLSEEEAEAKVLRADRDEGAEGVARIGHNRWNECLAEMVSLGNRVHAEDSERIIRQSTVKEPT